MTENVAKTRMRLRFARLEEAGNMSHLEQIKALRDIAAASGLDCCPAKQGKTLVPKMSFGPALSSGCGSRCEYADLYLAQACKEEVAMAKLAAVKSGTFSLLSVKRVPVFFPSIEASVSAARYLIEFKEGVLTRAAVDAFLALKDLPFEKVKPSGERKTLDARAPVLASSFDPESALLKITLKLEAGRNVKPETVAELMAGAKPAFKRIVRKELYWFDSSGKLEVF